MRACGECGFDFESYDDFEPGTSRCWACAAKAYKKGMERLKKERDKAVGDYLLYRNTGYESGETHE